MVGGEVPGESVGLALELLNDLGEPFGQAALGQRDLVFTDSQNLADFPHRAVLARIQIKEHILLFRHLLP